MNRYNQTPDKKSGIPVVLLAIIVLMLAGGGWLLWKNQSLEMSSQPETRALALPGNSERNSSVEPALAPEAASERIIELPQDNSFILPDLDHSDALLRQELTAVSPALADWLGGDQLIRQYIAIVNDAAQGLRLEKHVLFLKPEQPFAAVQDNRKLVMDAKSYRRYDRLAAAIGALDVQAALTLYQKIRPLLIQAFKEFSYPDEYSLEDIFIKAAAVILAAPIIDGNIELEAHGVRYKFVDQGLENLNPIHKQMLRMGPENTRLIQNKLRVLAEKLVSLKE
ncbi:MAG: DUF3014 domain-containing protein [Methylobacter sp.]